MKRAGKLLSYLVELIDKLSTSFGVMAVAIISLLMFIGIFARYFFHASIPFQSHIMLGLQVWMVLLLVGKVARDDEHVRIGTVSDLVLRKRARVFRRLFEDILALPLSIFLTWAGWHWIDLRIQRGDVIQYSANGTYAAWIPILCVFIGFLLASIFYAERLVKDLRPFLRNLRRGKQQPQTLEESGAPVREQETQAVSGMSRSQVGD